MLTKTDIEKYFIAEKQESLLFLVIGIIAVITAIIFLTILKNNFYRGAAIPLIAIGLLQIIVGYTVYKRTDTDRINMVYAYDLNPSKIKNTEIPRMEVVKKNFVIYRWIEIILAMTSLVLVIKYKSNARFLNGWSGNAFWLGLGVFLSVQSILMLGAAYFAEKRASIYSKGLQEFGNKK